MSGNDNTWAELTSQNERVIQLGESVSGSTNHAAATARSQWAELASQRERLVDFSDPLFRLASSRHSVSGMRLVAGAA